MSRSNDHIDNVEHLDSADHGLLQQQDENSPEKDTTQQDKATAQELPGVAVGDQEPTDLANMRQLTEIPFVDYRQSFPVPQSEENDLFDFNICDLPYVPHPVEPEVMQPCFELFSGGLDCLVGDTSQAAFASMENTKASDQASNACNPRETMEFGLQVNSSLPFRVPVAALQQQPTLSWRTDGLTPSSYAYDPGTSMSEATHQHTGTHKEVFLATAGWLNQLASLMQ